MAKETNFNSQFYLDYEYYLKNLHFLDWYRYFFIIKEVIKFKPNNVLEIGAGNEVIKNCLSKFVKDYKVMDINPKLKPDIIADLREFHPELKEKFDCVICAEVLEHTPFKDLEKNLTNVYNYLIPEGKIMITLPHQRIYFLFLSSLFGKKPYVVTFPPGFTTPRAFYYRFIKKEIWKDPHHRWEIGDGKIKQSDVESVIKKLAFSIEKFQKLLYADLFVLKKKINL
jgi:2-polyprenyl-3-methyl-5-hydroxy-6-metoxy-1,4-benzoquinol methylase